MQFIVTGYDGSDENAAERRAAVRDSHLKGGEKLFEEGKWLYAVGILNDNSQLIGSMVVCEFPSRQAVYEEWLNNEPYMTGDVWKKVEIVNGAVAPFCLEK